MAIKFIINLLFILLTYSAFGSNKDDWRELESLGNEILHSTESSPVLEKKVIIFTQKAQRLEKLEYKEDETEELAEKINAHLTKLKGKIYHPHFETFIHYMSWQNEKELRSPSKTYPLIITNSGLCAGGSVGFSNSNYYLFGDGCFFYGEGNVGATSNQITYKKSHLPTYGFKIAPSAGMFLTSFKTEMGLKIPILYTHQQLSTPNKNQYPNYKFRDSNNLDILSTIYFKWPIKNWNIQIEFGKLISKDYTLWGLGAGYQF